MCIFVLLILSLTGSQVQITLLVCRGGSGVVGKPFLHFLHTTESAPKGKGPAMFFGCRAQCCGGDRNLIGGKSS